MSTCEVVLIDSMGTDERVVDAARVSFNKKASQYSTEQNERLIKYLASHGHWTTTAHCFATFHIKAPIFVARQLVKHSVGLVWNEISRRYVDSEPVIYVPDVWRGRPTDKKQGSSKEPLGPMAVETISELYEESIKLALDNYEDMIKAGATPEQARMVLPLSMYTEWYWSGSLAAFARICNLRLKQDAQEETRDVAVEINKHMKELFPVTWGNLVKQDYESTTT